MPRVGQRRRAPKANTGLRGSRRTATGSHGGPFPGGNCETLNTEGVDSPRDYTRHERKTGWAAASIRTILTNERYCGIWRFNQRRWMREPGTNRRVPQLNPPSAIISYERPDLAIIARDTWELAQERIRRTQAKYISATSGRYRRVDLSNCHVLSTLLRCECGSAVHIHGGYSKKSPDTDTPSEARGGIRSQRRYYGCVDARRGRCENRTSLREDLAQRRLLERYRHQHWPEDPRRARRSPTAFVILGS
ncbi:MAG: hypothetical protein JWM53_6331 [bacterium]|nr:hypothetical protein [bacterium]